MYSICDKVANIKPVLYSYNLTDLSVKKLFSLDSYQVSCNANTIIRSYNDKYAFVDFND